MKINILNPIKHIYHYRRQYKPFIILYLVIVTAAAVSLSIINQSNALTDNIISEYAGLMKIDSVYGNRNSSLRMTKQDFADLSSIRHVDRIVFYRYNINFQTLDDNILPISKTLTIGNERKTNWGAPGQPFFIFGYNTDLKYLELDGIPLEKGRWFESENEAVINKNVLCPSMEVSGWNDLDIGDKIAIDNGGGISKEFTIIGILAQDPLDDEETYKYEIYTSFENAEYFDKINTNKKISYERYHEKSDYTWQLGFVGYEALVYLDSPDNFISVKDELMARGINAVSFFSDANSMLSITTAMQHSCVIYVIITAFLVLCVTVISIHILLSSRKYEIAVLRSIGMSKASIIISYVFENIIFIWLITLISLIVAGVISPLLTRNTFEQIKSMVSPDMFGKISSVSRFALIMQDAGTVFAGMTITVIVSNIITAVGILRFSPLKIYNKRY